jgi:hypothetical protein
VVTKRLVVGFGGFRLAAECPVFKKKSGDCRLFGDRHCTGPAGGSLYSLHQTVQTGWLFIVFTVLDRLVVHYPVIIHCVLCTELTRRSLPADGSMCSLHRARFSFIVCTVPDAQESWLDTALAVR